MDPNENPFNTQNSSNHPFHYQNPNNYQFPNQYPNQPHPQNMPNYGFTPNFAMPLGVPNYHPYPYYGSTMPQSSQTTEFPGFSTQVAFGGMSSTANVSSPTMEESTPTRKKNAKWTTDQNLVLLSGWIKYGTDSVVGRNQKSEAYWGKIAEYCNEHCSFQPPRDGSSCRNHFNYMNKILGKWIGAYDNAKRLQQSGWSENDVLTKAHEIYSTGTSVCFNLMSEWHAIRDQPRYGSQVGGNTGSESSGSKRSRESDASDSNSVGSIARPMGRDATKKKGKKKGKAAALEVVNEDWNEFRQLKVQEMEKLDKIAMIQDETKKIIKEKTEAKKLKMFLKLSEKEHLDDCQKKIFEKLNNELFGN